MLTVKINPHQKPGELNGFVDISCYAPFMGDSSKQCVSKSTIDTIVKNINEVERQLPGYAVIIMGDFNGLPIKLPSYNQVVTKATHNANIRHAYQCHQFFPLQCDASNPSDHNFVHQLPSYMPKSQLKLTMVTKRSYTPVLHILISNGKRLQSYLD